MPSLEELRKIVEDAAKGSPPPDEQIEQVSEYLKTRETDSDEAES